MGKIRTWRDGCKPIIHKVLKENEGKTDKEIRKALLEAYPFGERAYHPYKIWLDEIKVQRGLKRTKQQVNLDNQPSLFQ